MGKLKAIDCALEDLIDTVVVRRSNSPWAFPVVLVSKKYDSSRLSVDYRRLSDVTGKDAHPLPNLNSILPNLDIARYFTTLDDSRAYLQARSEASDDAKTTFCCHRELLEFTRMPFGLCGAPVTFQRLTDRVLGEAKCKHATAYLGDVVLYANTFEDYPCDLMDVLAA